MPVQTTKKTNIYFPDGAAVSVDTGSGYVDLGAINSAVTATLEWEESLIETANAGPLDKYIREMTMSGGFTLINLDPEGIYSLGGGVFTKVTTAGSEVSTIPVQTIAANWSDATRYELIMETSSTDDTKLRMATAPVLTSVVLDPGDAAEALTAWGAAASGDYTVVADSASYSGWSIVFNSASMATGTPKTKTIAITYAANTPVGSETIYAGSSSATLTAFSMRIRHTDSSSLTRTLELFAVDSVSGGFQFNFKGANEKDTLEEMPITFMAKIDSDLTDGRQLMAWTVDAGCA